MTFPSGNPAGLGIGAPIRQLQLHHPADVDYVSPAQLRFQTSNSPFLSQISQKYTFVLEFRLSTAGLRKMIEDKHVPFRKN
jgi:hypothetical protein